MPFPSYDKSPMTVFIYLFLFFLVRSHDAFGERRPASRGEGKRAQNGEQKNKNKKRISDSRYRSHNGLHVNKLRDSITFRVST